MITAGVTAVEAAGVSVLFLRLRGKEQAAEARNRAQFAIDRLFFQLCKGQLPKILPTGYGHAVQVLDARGRVLSSTRALHGRPRMATFVPAPGRMHAERTLPLPGGPDGRMTVRAVSIVSELCRHQRGRGPLLIYLAAPSVPWYGSRRLAMAAAGASVLVTAIAVVGAYWSTARALTPAEEVRKEFAEITATDLSRRVPVPGHQELKALARTMNDTLGRLEVAVANLRHLASDASHDLRGPLTGIRTRMEEALTHPEEADWPQAAADVLAGVERQQAIVADLLTLTRLDTGQPLRLQRTDLADLVADELRGRTTDRIPIASSLRRRVMVDCDRLLIDRLLANLLDNAQRHANDTVTVTVTAQNSTAILEVTDDGDGIPPDQREKVFERFTRLKSSRDRDPHGSGMGLPISRQIAQAHNGTLNIETHPQHHTATCFVLRLPLRSH
ncbi:sensor histidine kinase [Thermomonospora echinospora]|uniref:sensor histidine kinase n=1 Tax=Thermomonospora echinospora TaxID=1992 RepID=UPI00135B6F54|nr:HAMP domain-containing sensor histidine kinase [Thermomonospora echinospora]